MNSYEDIVSGKETKPTVQHKELNIIKPNLYYFETDNKNQVIQTKLDLAGGKMNKTFDQRKSTACLTLCSRPAGRLSV